MKKLILLFLFGVMPAFGQTVTEVPQMSVSNLPTAPPLNTVVKVIDPISARDCTVGGGNGVSFPPHDCQWSGTIWAFLAAEGVCSQGSTAVPYFNGTVTVCDPNAALDGNGNETAVSVTAATVTAATVNTTGPGYTQIFQSQTAPNGTFLGNMAAGQMVWYGDSGTNKWTCLNKDASSCSPGGAAFSGITAAANSNAGTFSASGNSWDFTGTTIFKLRVTAGCTTTVVGDLCYDSTSKMWHIWMNGADNFLVTALASGSYTDQNCVKLVKTGALFNLADSGGACGGSGSAAPIIFGCPAFTNTTTQYCGGGNISTSQNTGQTPVPRSGTVTNLQCRVAGPGLSSSQTLALTVFKGAASIGAITPSSTTMTCTLNSTNTNGCSDGTHNFTVAAGDVLQIQSVPTNSPTNNSYICTVQY